MPVATKLPSRYWNTIWVSNVVSDTLASSSIECTLIEPSLWRATWTTISNACATSSRTAAHQHVAPRRDAGREEIGHPRRQRALLHEIGERRHLGRRLLEHEARAARRDRRHRGGQPRAITHAQIDDGARVVDLRAGLG